MTVQPATARDFDTWHPLWQGYLAHCKFSYQPDQARLTWSRLLAHEQALYAVLLQRNGTVVGFAHYLFHYTTTTAQPFCNLQDLYVSPAVRRQGGARMLIEAVAQAARVHGAEGFYWLTERDNDSAQALYSQVAVRTGHVLYALPLHAHGE